MAENPDILIAWLNSRAAFFSAYLFFIHYPASGDSPGLKDKQQGGVSSGRWVDADAETIARMALEAAGIYQE